jgi:hypothetical protein
MTYDGGDVATRSCFDWAPGDYECDLTTTNQNNLRIYVLVADDGTYTWEWAGG